MKYMLDTNICIFIMRNKSEALKKKFFSVESDSVCISSITFAELMRGVFKSKLKVENLKTLILLLRNIPIYSFDSGAAVKFGELVADLEAKGTKIGRMDSLIAGHALSENLTLVTNNTREFERVEGLKVEDWTE